MAKSRRGMTFRRVVLDSAEAGDSRVGGTVNERLLLVKELSLAAWTTTGKPLPQYDRAHMPIRIVRLGEPKDRKRATGRTKDLADLEQLEQE